MITAHSGAGQTPRTIHHKLNHQGMRLQPQGQPFSNLPQIHPLATFQAWSRFRGIHRVTWSPAAASGLALRRVARPRTHVQRCSQVAGFSHAHKRSLTCLELAEVEQYNLHMLPTCSFWGPKCGHRTRVPRNRPVPKCGGLVGSDRGAGHDPHVGSMVIDGAMHLNVPSIPRIPACQAAV